MKSILFVCTGNTCRSPMAAALFSKLMRERGLDANDYRIYTAGLAAGNGLPPSTGALEAMRHEGLDISGHRSSQLTGYLVEQADLILTMTRSHCSYIRDNFPVGVERVYTLMEYAMETGPDIPDPYGQDHNQYLKSAREIKRVLYKIIERLLAYETDGPSRIGE